MSFIINHNFTEADLNRYDHHFNETQEHCIFNHESDSITKNTQNSKCNIKTTDKNDAMPKHPV